MMGHMALINEFQEVEGATQRRHGPVTCGYRTFVVEGEVLLQLDTYGSAERQIPDKISQSIQLNVEGARELMSLLVEVFPELDRGA